MFQTLHLDEPTADLLTQRMQVHETTAWLLQFNAKIVKPFDCPNGFGLSRIKIGPSSETELQR